MRRKQSPVVELFVRSWWPDRLAKTSLKLRLLCRESADGSNPWSGGLSEAEREALEHIAGGGLVEDLDYLDARFARSMLDAYWLRAS